MNADPLDVIDWDLPPQSSRPRGVNVVALVLLAVLLAAAGIVVWTR